MSIKANPEAVVLGALFDFAGHMRGTFSLDPFKSVDSFARLRKLAADEVPTMNWRILLDTLASKPLPTDSVLVKDLLVLAEAFKDGDPSADTSIFDLLGHAATRLRQAEADQVEAERYRFVAELGTNEAFASAVEEADSDIVFNQQDPETKESLAEDIDKTMNAAIEAGLWPLKDGAQ